MRHREFILYRRPASAYSSGGVCARARNIPHRSNVCHKRVAECCLRLGVKGHCGDGGYKKNGQAPAAGDA